MGWNDVPCMSNPLFEGLEKGALFYFYIPIILMQW
jgi:imidazoleglycerol phosphate synthase glutamine amidotransferase subunit HisH